MSPFKDERADQWDSVNRSIVTARLVSAMVHDARNTLQGVAGMAELLVSQLEAEQPKAAERVRQILIKCLTLGERLETFKSVQDSVPVHLERRDLALLCARAVELRQASWGPRQISASINIEPGTIVLADATGVLRIVLNLLLNAERALSRPGGGRITFTATQTEDDVRLVVEDSGVGVSPDAEPKLFRLLGEDGRLHTGLWTSARLAECSNAKLAWLGPDGRRAAFELRLISGR